MTYNDAEARYAALNQTQCVQLREQLVRAAIEYARIRVDWQLAAPSQRRGIGLVRTAIHDRLIEACQQLGRTQAEAGEDASWLAALGEDRRDVGDFACFVHAILGIQAR